MDKQIHVLPNILVCCPVYSPSCLHAGGDDGGAAAPVQFIKHLFEPGRWVKIFQKEKEGNPIRTCLTAVRN